MVNSLTLSSTVTLILSVASLIGAQNTTTTATAPPAQVSPAYLSGVTPIAGNVQSYPTGGNTSIPTGALPALTFNITGYPAAWVSPPITSTEVIAAINSIDWSLVPTAAVRKADAKGDLTFTGYDSNTDPDCWWSASGCTVSKNPIIAPDYYRCPNAGEWGLTYDDGPLTPDAGSYAEPQLYNFLAAHNQKAGLFYIGSNVIAAPAAAQRALADGHTICVHTWSHPPMTTLANDNVVAELYWTLKALKEVLGITTKCWRPPYGDVDDRVRAIAWQMGLHTVLWDEDSNDWNMPGSGGGNLPPATVDGYFEGWISARQNGSDNATGHVVLEHELNNSTVAMAEKWLPQIQEVFNVVPWNQCFNIVQPYWETNFVYPAMNGTITTNTTAAVTPAAAANTNTVKTVPSNIANNAGSSARAAAASSTSTSIATKNLAISGSTVSVFLGMIAIACYAA